MKLKKANVSEILTFVMMFTLFFALMISFFYNSIVQEKRSLLVDFLNKEAMTLQAELEGYSKYEDYCFIFENGSKVGQSRAEQIKNNAIEESKTRIAAYFSENRNASQLTLKDIVVNIDDSNNVKSVAKVTIEVQYYASFRSPYSKEDGGSGKSSSKVKFNMKDTASRVIENPIRQKNTKG